MKSMFHHFYNARLAFGVTYHVHYVVALGMLG
jgi:hypothetical protein